MASKESLLKKPPRDCYYGSFHNLSTQKDIDCYVDWSIYKNECYLQKQDCSKEERWMEQLDMPQRWGDDELMMLGEQAAIEKPGLDWTAASIGAGVGFVVGVTLMKAFRRKADDEFSRV